MESDTAEFTGESCAAAWCLERKGVPPRRDDEPMTRGWCWYDTPDSTWLSAGIEDSLVIFFSVLIVTQHVLSNSKENEILKTHMK